jgi:hypothetical protein
MEGKASVTSNVGAGGVWVDQAGTFTMKDNASVSGNSRSSSDGGGGVTVNNGTFTMEGGTISGNTSSSSDSGGGGVSVNNGTFTMKGGTISGNSSSAYGGGVYIITRGIFTMSGGTISGNTARKSGGGVSVSGGTFTMEGGTISGNSFSSSTPYGAFGVGGGGVHLTYSTAIFIMKDGSVSGNTTNEVGGGVIVCNGTFTMQGGTISGNTASNGGGVGGDLTMQGGTISGNTASLGGGGVYVSGSFTKTGGTIYGDDADQKLKNTVVGGMGHSMYDAYNRRWRNATAGQTMNPDSYGFWLNEGDLVMFPGDFMRTWKRTNFNNTLMVSGNAIKSSSRDFVWVLQSVSGDRYTLKRADAANTMTLTIKQAGYSSLEISGDSGSGENNWNGTWRRQ